MATELKLPELGENIDSGNVVKVLVSVGQRVQQDQPVIELETDKATIEVPSNVSGVVREIFVHEGGTAKVGQVVLTVDSGEKHEETKQPSKEPAKTRQAEATHESGKREAPQPVVSTLAVETPALPGSEEEAEKPRLSVVRTAPEAPPPEPAPRKVVPASPSVRRLAREIGLDIADVTGTGPGGRITSDDVKLYSRELNEGRRSTFANPSISVPLPDFSRWGIIERQPMTTIRQKTAEHMAVAWANIPQVTQFDHADITRLEEYRKQFGNKAEAAGGKLTVTAILLKVVASALKMFPQFNASLDMVGREIVFKKYYHIGVAVDTDRGLLVPVIRDVDRKNILQLSIELTKIAEKARNKKLSLEEMQGGTFTITNLGGIGGSGFSPIVNHPEVAILGISRSSLHPVYVEGQLEPRMILPLSLSYDHRLIDGANAARFLRWLCDALQDPFLVALEG